MRRSPETLPKTRQRTVEDSVVPEQLNGGAVLYHFGTHIEEEAAVGPEEIDLPELSPSDEEIDSEVEVEDRGNGVKVYHFGPPPQRRKRT
jgi:hypothetical protein